MQDFRHGIWEKASSKARKELKELASKLEAEIHSIKSYSVRLVRLTISRFDTWARRGQSVGVSTDDLHDYEAWLTNCRRHWIVYLADTCTKVDMTRELRTRLAKRISFWTTRERSREI